MTRLTSPQDDRIVVPATCAHGGGPLHWRAEPVGEDRRRWRTLVRYRCGHGCAEVTEREGWPKRVYTERGISIRHQGD